MDDLLPALRALADPVRLRIVDFLRAPQANCCSRDDGVCGCDFEALLGVSQPTVSHHMKQLVEAGLVRSERRGRWVYYELDRAAMGRVVARLRPLADAAPARSAA